MPWSRWMAASSWADTAGPAVNPPTVLVAVTEATPLNALNACRPAVRGRRVRPVQITRETEPDGERRQFQTVHKLRGRGPLGRRLPGHREASFADDLDADSLDLVELVMALEEEFDVNVEEEELEGITTIGAAYDLITGKL